MRYLLSCIIVFVSIIGCSTPSSSDTMEIAGEVKGLKKGVLLLQKFEDTVLVTIDSVIISGKSNFHFSETVESPEIYYLHVRLKDGSLMDDRIAFFGENSDMQITTYLENFGSAARISGSKNDSLLRVYDKLKQRFVTRNLDLIEKKLKLKNPTSDSLKLAIEKQQQSLVSNKYFATINFAINHSDFEIAPYLILSEAYNAKVKYLDTVYDALSPKVKASKYGKELETFIKDRKVMDTEKSDPGM